LRLRKRLCPVLLVFGLALPLAGGGALAMPVPYAKKKVLRIVLDPGHGGQDEGTGFQDGGRRVTEKEVTLGIAIRAARELRARGYTVNLTRYDDREMPLKERTAIANRLKADLFISIHMNSTATRGAGAEGVETYILDNASDETSWRLAHFENSVLSPGDAGTPEQTDVALILKDLRLDANLSESKRLACAVQESLVLATSRFKVLTQPMLQVGRPRSPSWSLRAQDRGVRQALFYVLLGADMPSALVEAGFLSNFRDRSIVVSPQGRQTLALAIAKAVDQFKRERRLAGDSSVLSRCKVN
jgi:N-acetylmuramoyl-L-alanine amidase